MMLTDKQIREMLAAQLGWNSPSWVTDYETRAYRLGWQERGKRDAEVCRESVRISSIRMFADQYEQCALAIERLDADDAIKLPDGMGE